MKVYTASPIFGNKISIRWATAETDTHFIINGKMCPKGESRCGTLNCKNWGEAYNYIMDYYDKKLNIARDLVVRLEKKRQDAILKCLEVAEKE